MGGEAIAHLGTIFLFWDLLSSLPVMDTAPEVGSFVQVRSRLWIVETREEFDDDVRLDLACLDDDAQGRTLSILWRGEVDARVVLPRSGIELAERGFDAPDRFVAYLDVQRWSCVTAADPTLFQSPLRAGIELKVFQLEPLRKALLLPRVNLFIADDVGLGKTIEAGLILRELLLRQRVRRVVIGAPPSVVRQWQEEMGERFGLSFQVFDRAFVQSRRRERGYSVNPWSTHNLFIVSHALLRDEAYLAPLRMVLEKDPEGSLLVFDEAHNAAPATDAKYTLDTKTTRSIRELAERFEHRLFLSATPHNGHANSFTALLEILDPQRFTRGVPLDDPPKQLAPVMVRRLKSELREHGIDFAERKVVRVVIDGLPKDAPEIRLSEMLDQYRQLRAKRLASATAAKQQAATLIDVSLQKRLLSSIEALATTLATHRTTLRRNRDEVASKRVVEPRLNLLAESPGADDERAEIGEDHVAAEERAQMEAATTLCGVPTPAELTLLDDLIELADRYRSAPDPRVHYITRWLKEHLCPDLPARGERPAAPAPWLDRVVGRKHGARLLIFTEYTDTKRYLQEQLRAILKHTDRGNERVEVFQGGIGEDKREKLKRAFNADPAANVVRILIATDAAREGINLQNHCADLFHFDLPWNPSRLEQRNGRIDRTLQRESMVRCHYFVLPQRVGDRVLDVMVQKVDRIQKELGSLGKVIEERLTRALVSGIPGSREGAMKEAIDGIPEVRDDEVERARTRGATIAGELEALRKLLDAAKRHLRLESGQLAHAVSVALELMEAPRLVALDPARDRLPSGKLVPPGAFQFPALDQLAGADPGWVALLDGLRVPKEEEEYEDRWRRTAPLRPVVFASVDSLDADVVHLHLEHRIVQRLLGRFRSQGFKQTGLSRVSAIRARVDGLSVPHVLLCGRIGLYGHGAARLHEEILWVAAEWRDTRSDRSKFKVLNVGETARLIVAAQPAIDAAEPVGAPVLKQLATTFERDRDALLARIEDRSEIARRGAFALLERRSREERKAIRQVLELQKNRIAEKLADTQLELPGLTVMDRKLANDARAFWEKRATQIEPEIEREEARIARAYEHKSTRLEPLGLLYLWPTTG